MVALYGWFELDTGPLEQWILSFQKVYKSGVVATVVWVSFVPQEIHN